MKVRLFGELGEKFGTEFDFKVNSISEAVRALQANLPGFKQHMISDKSGYHLIMDNEDVVPVTVKDVMDVDEESGKKLIEMGESTGFELCIVPVTMGAGKAVSFIVGAVLIVVGVVIGVYTQNWALAYKFIGVGIAMIAGGVVQLLSPQPSLPTRPETQGADDPGKFFSGTVNTYSQGHPIPVVYGRLRVGCAVVSLGKTAERYSAGDKGGPFGLNNHGGDGITVPKHWYVEAI